MLFAQSWLGSGYSELINPSLACRPPELIESLLRRLEVTVFFRKIPTPVDPAEDTAKTAAAGVSRCDPPIHAWAVKFRVFAAVAAADNFFRTLGKGHWIKRSKPGPQVSWIAAVELSHCRNQNTEPRMSLPRRSNSAILILMFDFPPHFTQACSAFNLVLRPCTTT